MVTPPFLARFDRPACINASHFRDFTFLCRIPNFIFLCMQNSLLKIFLFRIPNLRFFYAEFPTLDFYAEFQTVDFYAKFPPNLFLPSSGRLFDTDLAILSRSTTDWGEFWLRFPSELRLLLTRWTSSLTESGRLPSERDFLKCPERNACVQDICRVLFSAAQP
jgi:hypothetical protein